MRRGAAICDRRIAVLAPIGGKAFEALKAKSHARAANDRDGRAHGFGAERFRKERKRAGVKRQTGLARLVAANFTRADETGTIRRCSCLSDRRAKCCV